MVFVNEGKFTKWYSLIRIGAAFSTESYLKVFIRNIYNKTNFIII